MGLLVAAEIANAYLFEKAPSARDYNHPSIINWTPVNESWGLPNLG